MGPEYGFQTSAQERGAGGSLESGKNVGQGVWVSENSGEGKLRSEENDPHAISEEPASEHFGSSYGNGLGRIRILWVDRSQLKVRDQNQGTGTGSSARGR